MAYRDIEVRRQRDRERFHRRTAERRAAGLCPRCGKRPPAEGHKVCEPCADKANRASRVRDARLRAEGKPRRDPARAKACGRARDRRVHAERRAAGLCVRCGRVPAMPETIRVRAVSGKAPRRGPGALPGGQGRREALRRQIGGGQAKERPHRQQKAPAGAPRRWSVHAVRSPTPSRAPRSASPAVRRAEPPSANSTPPARPPAYAFAAAAGPSTRLAVRPLRRARIRARKPGTEKRRLATDVRGTQSPRCLHRLQRSGVRACRCPECAKRSYERSDFFKGLPLYPPSFTVIELATGECHGVFDCEADVALCLAFAKLARDQVEVIPDVSPVARFAAWA